MPSMKTEWFLIADASRARVVAREEGQPLHVVATFEHPASREKTSSLGDDKAGRELSGRGFGGAAFEPRADAHRKEHLRFAHELAGFIEQRAAAGAFDELSIFAPDPFLGELKDQLGHGTRQRLAAARQVDLSAVGAAELETRIGHALAT